MAIVQRLPILSPTAVKRSLLKEKTWNYTLNLKKTLPLKVIIQSIIYKLPKYFTNYKKKTTETIAPQHF